MGLAITVFMLLVFSLILGIMNYWTYDYLKNEDKFEGKPKLRLWCFICAFIPGLLSIFVIVQNALSRVTSEIKEIFEEIKENNNE